MATKHWRGDATAVAQVATGSIDSVDATPANNTFTVTIGGRTVSAVGNTDVATTATNLRSNLNASTHPYFSAITWSGTGGSIVGTADVAGVPFVAALTVSGGGTGSVTDFAATTASAGPFDWSTAANWSDGAVPGNADEVYIDRGSAILFGLNQTAVDLALLVHRSSFVAAIGLPSTSFMQDPTAGTTAAVAEYRGTYLDIGYDRALIGETLGIATGQGSGRIKIRNDKAGASETIVLGTASQATESSLPAVRLLFANASAELYVQDAVAGVGVAIEVPGETSNLSVCAVGAQGLSTRVFIGDGVTITTWAQTGGDNRLDAAATVTTVTAAGGRLTIEGDFTITTLELEGDARVIDNHIKTSGNAVTTAALNGGELDLTRSREPRTYATVNLGRPSTLRLDDYITITTLNEPATRHQISVT